MIDGVPDRGDVVWLDLDPRVGHEQSGHRPVLVLSPARYNVRQGMLIGCPITSRVKGNPFEVVIGRTPPSVVLVDQIRTLDWRARGARPKDHVAPTVVAEVIARLDALIGV